MRRSDVQTRSQMKLGSEELVSSLQSRADEAAQRCFP